MNNTYIPIIDGLRALAVILVLLFHLKVPGFQGGFIGVDIFFVISGYLITSIYILETKKNKKFDFANYLKKRIFRLVPALIFVVFISLIISFFVLSPFDLIDVSKSSIYSILFLSNIFFFFESSYWANLNEYKIFIHTWSLGIEMSFYLLMPIFLYSIQKLNNNLKIYICLLIILLSLILIFFAISKGPTIESTLFNKIFYGKEVADIIFYLIPFRFFEFIFGSILYFLPQVKFGIKTKQIGFFLGFLLIFLTLFLINPNHKYQGIIVSLALIGSSLIIYFKEAKIINKILNNKITIFIGLISYSLYLVHWPIISFFKYILVIELTNFFKIIIIFLSILSSFLIYKFIEIPFRNKNFKFRSYPVLISILFVSFFSNLVQNKDGFIERLNTEQKEILSKITNLKEPCKRKHSMVYKLRYKICLDGNEKDSNILVLGDSNATTWFPLSQKLAKKINSSVVNYRRICNSFPKNSAKECKEIDTDAEILIIGNLWYGWQSKQENISTDIKRYVKNINDLKNNQNFSEIKKIIIFGQIPALRNENLGIMSCLLKPKFFFNYQDCEKKYSYLDDKEKNLEKYKEVNKYLKLYGNKIISKNFDFLFIDPIKSLCKSGECIQYKNKEIFYANNNHLSTAAVNYIYEDYKVALINFLK